MSPTHLQPKRVRALLDRAAANPILVVGDAMLDHFVWGTVARISPEAPVPVVDFSSESLMPGGAANVARNLRALGAPAEMFAVVGKDASGEQLRQLLRAQNIGCKGLIAAPNRPTSVKMRIVAHKQQVVRIDRETRDGIDSAASNRLLRALKTRVAGAGAVIVGDYGKGVVTQSLLNALKQTCRERGIWLSVDPKPVHSLDLSGISLLTPNRKEAFELAGVEDEARRADPLADT
ncbi:MAG TPA: PfkB family carbohydrate kinase, partial [Bryobacteraceae bacterium]|nr:PfkB family carbohydrate kinase [Bryobacteraceae bacterium]